MRRVAPEHWQPAVGIDLEENADIVARSNENYLVVAGPGAGKTELLAQRANFLLETNFCADPARILAISFKRDAANNLRERVAARCSPDMASRFDSHTFDSFATGILDRFREGLGLKLQIPAEYEIVENSQILTRVTTILGNLRSDTDFSTAVNTLNIPPKVFLEKYLCVVPLTAFKEPESELHVVAKKVWIQLLSYEQVMLTYDMVKRLAERIIVKNPLLSRALRITYSHVFLDEFQDTTGVQFDLLRTCFPGPDTVLTAVGDNKQRIMLWANAMPDAFDQFEQYYGAKRVKLLRNRRSDCRLVEIQDFLIAAIEPTDTKIEPAPDKKTGDGVCEILEFNNEIDEAHHVATMAAALIESGVKPNDICIIVKQTVEKAVGHLIHACNEIGIRCRVEGPFQEVMKDELVQTILSMLQLTIGIETGKHWAIAFKMTCALEGIDDQDNKGTLAVEARLSQFISALSAKMMQIPSNPTEFKLILDEIVGFFNLERIRATFPKHLNPNSVPSQIDILSRLLSACSENSASWAETLVRFVGEDAIPAMTIHKSKGLEYHTVFFIGLEDSSWWSFQDRRAEDTCSFFVAFSRAKKQVYFTFCSQRKTVQSRNLVFPLYELLVSAGVTARKF